MTFYLERLSVISVLYLLLLNIANLKLFSRKEQKCYYLDKTIYGRSLGKAVGYVWNINFIPLHFEADKLKNKEGVAVGMSMRCRGLVIQTCPQLPPLYKICVVLWHDCRVIRSIFQQCAKTLTSYLLNPRIAII